MFGAGSSILVRSLRLLNFIQITRTPGKSWRYIDFSRWRASTSQFHLRFRVNIYLHTKFRWDFSIHGGDVTTFGFCNQMSAMLEFYFRFWFSRLRHSWACHSVTVCQISSKSDHPRQTYDYDVTSISQDGGHGIAILLPVSHFVTLLI